ncbi:tetratricopeptide repeat protein [Aureibacter tunicatorum]|uniref:Tetratricopeptide (TPR) repeat protein n=1 Tax=Aureibacter tunicatorum TaxID=866807 RepID=A0AAE4BUI5_9BACT|nr:hypothetical protein [Aureibacter tunicatorum]MDR6241105.1 tetratricopeptide (TPR) repeat protein [Aureibacter tunicatorum]BDD03883.1 hypothetical protein AUTU_13660 [Aureibacter tunicatorum]
MRIILIIILTLSVHISFSQTVEDLEYELSYYKSGETWGNKKDIARKLLEIDNLNNKAINYLVEVYGRNNQRDSIVVLFDSLIKNNPNNPEPYLIRAGERNAHFAGLTFTKRINYLKKAIEIDNKNIEATYLLGQIYYELFNKEYNNNKKKVNLDYYSQNATIYFNNLISINGKYIETVKIPLIQLANYIDDDKKIIELAKKNIQSSYFPIIAFAGLPDNWKTDYSVNVITHVSDFSVTGVESAIFSINWYSRHLKALEEPVLSDSLPTKIYRFTYLRTFHNPIVIRIENDNGDISIYWKVSDGAGGYDPGKIITNKSKELTAKDWKRIEDEINSIKFWSLPTAEKELLGTDGSQWILEGKTLGKYHVVDRWCGGKISSVCKELIELTDIELKEDDVY